MLNAIAKTLDAIEDEDLCFSSGIAKKNSLRGGCLGLNVAGFQALGFEVFNPFAPV